MKEIKDRLVSLLYDVQDARIDTIADYLLANGVIVTPCKIGTHLWKVTYPYRQEPKVTEFVVKNFRTTGKKHTLQIEVQAVNVSGTNWMQYKDFCTTREEAEAKLREEHHEKD